MSNIWKLLVVGGNNCEGPIVVEFNSAEAACKACQWFMKQHCAAAVINDDPNDEQVGQFI